MAGCPVTLITGGSSGIGAARAGRLLAAGHRVTVTGRDSDRLARFAEEAEAKPDTLLTVVADACDYPAVEAAVQAAS
ncbi:SDR family NAD(P)-dependent oxidoreductase [Streptantibioticus ferralitis]|uniref:SDR family NAD(P)-dependent oxidoreductase n=1 Tax=Streptantibioticus ferralitis TaxID=236510 RepID=A0ABT5YW16_9ACTN|nr:SDR family NAD(P)-dependent oxidoreductase [Streptantibioticus ferralitis]MDF2255639.1 SDR family NAD(P)-dependent oxidoreductase [Streptantibioticus ferralitis]